MALNLPYDITNGNAADATELQENFEELERWAQTDTLNADGSVAATAALTLPGDPTNSLHAATKGYVDTQDTAYAALKLSLAGGTMSGAIAMGSQKITGLGDATAAADAMNRQASDARYLKLSGGTMTGAVAMGSQKITGLGDATAAADAMNRQASDARYLKLSGGTMTGKITLDDDPSSNLHATPKQYVDANSGSDTTASGAPTTSGTTSTLVLILTANVTAQRDGIAIVTVMLDVSAGASPAGAFTAELRSNGSPVTESVVWNPGTEAQRQTICNTWHVAVTEDTAYAFTIYVDQTTGSGDYTIGTTHTNLRAVVV